MSFDAGLMSRRAAVLAAALALALGANACGGSDDDDGGDGGGATAATGDGTATVPTDLPKEALDPRGEEEEQIVIVYRKYADAMAATDAKTACTTLSPNAVLEIGGGVSCVQAVRNLYELGEQSQIKPYIVKLRVNGKRAHAKVKTRTDETSYPVNFTKQPNGEWMLDGSRTTK